MRLNIVYVFVLIGFVAFGWAQHSRIKALKSERDTYKSNTNVLLEDVKTYKTSDSLNAAKVGVLELKLKDFEKYRAADAEVIKSLQIKNRELTSITTTQIETINSLKGVVRDSFIYVDRVVVDSFKTVNIVEPYFEMHGVIKNNLFTGSFVNKDSLYIVSTVEYKRFLGFLWRTRKVKNREVDITSRNPNTKIIGFSFVEIKK